MRGLRKLFKGKYLKRMRKMFGKKGLRGLRKLLKKKGFKGFKKYLLKRFGKNGAKALGKFLGRVGMGILLAKGLDGFLDYVRKRKRRSKRKGPLPDPEASGFGKCLSEQMISLTSKVVLKVLKATLVVSVCLLCILSLD